MEKRRIRLEINGVVCGLITEESDEYMQSLADEVGDLMRQITESSPYITREAAALTVALSYCDDAKKNGEKAFGLQERIDELEVEAELWQEEKAELQKDPPAASQPSPDPALLERLQKLETENTALAQAAGELESLRQKAEALEDENAALQQELAQKAAVPAAVPAAPAPAEAPAVSTPAAPAVPHSARKNPLRYEDDLKQESFISFFEKK